MKKSLIIIALVFATVISSVGVSFVNGQEVMEECTMVREINYNGNQYAKDTTYSITENDGEGAVVCLINTVNRAAQILFYLMVALVVAFVILGGFLVLTAGANEDNIAKGKNYITYAIIGVFIAVFAYLVPNLIIFVLG